MREHFATHCQAPRCRFASLLLPSLDVAEKGAQKHAQEQAHCVIVRATTERVVSVHGQPCACRSEAVKA